MAKRTKNYYVQFEYRRWTQEFCRLHYMQRGMLIDLLFQLAHADDEGRPLTVKTEQQLATLLNVEPKHRPWLRDLLTSHFVKRPDGLHCEWIDQILLDRRLKTVVRKNASDRANRIRWKNQQKNTGPQRIRNGSDADHTQSKTHTHTERERAGADAPLVELSELGSLVAHLTEDQKAELRRKGKDPAHVMARFADHGNTRPARMPVWLQRFAKWVKDERPAPTANVAPFNRTPDQIAEAEREQQAAARAKDAYAKRADERLAALVKKFSEK